MSGVRKLLPCMHSGCTAAVRDYRKFCDEHNRYSSQKAAARAELEATARDYVLDENQRLRARVAELEGQAPCR